jgi:hypothetical protein
MLAGAFILAIQVPISRFLVAALMAAVVVAGTRQMLRAFPFTQEVRERLKISPETYDRSACIGWPVPPKNHERWNLHIGHWQAACVALAVAWLLFCGAFHFREFGECEAILQNILVWIAGLFALGRLYVYLRGYMPPISILGRIATGRIVIPGYDFVLAAPLAAVVAAWLVPPGLAALGLHPATAIPIAAGAAAWMALALPPRLQDWQLTGQHRIAYRFLAAIEARSASKLRE